MATNLKPQKFWISACERCVIKLSATACNNFAKVSSPGKVILSLVILLGCQQNISPSQNIVNDNGVTYLNTALSVQFVGSDACYDCHQEIYDTYFESEMGRSMEKLSSDNIIEKFPQSYAVYDSVRNFYYEMFTKNRQFFQREYRQSETGEVIHERVVEAEYTLGSGNNLRMYFFSEGGMLYEMPLTWYTHKEKWDLSPGYRQYQNLRFSRYANERCIACHNSFLERNPKTINRYIEPFELGVGCERCHGPGALHVEEHAKKFEPSGTEKTIVNPRKLSRQRQLDVCGQCHLQGKAWAIRPEKEAFDFRPGMLLSSHRSVYYTKKTRTEVFEVADSAQRLALSKCFQESDELTCITCHNPHYSIKTFSSDYYNKKCLTCHDDEALFEEKDHQKNIDCISCHMKSTGTDNSLHGVTTTDHWIRKNAVKAEIDWTILRLPDEEKPIITLNAEIDAEDGNKYLQKSIAYLDYYRERDPRKTYLDSALFYLNKISPVSVYENYYKLRLQGSIYFEMGKLKDALNVLRKCIEFQQSDAALLHDIAIIYKKLKQYDKAVPAALKAVDLKPESPEYLEFLGDLFNRVGDAEAAVNYLKTAITIDKQNPNTYYLLGNMYALKLNQPDAALEYYLAGLKRAPDFPRLNLNIGNTYARLGQFEKAIYFYNREIDVAPVSSDAFLNLGQVYNIMGNKSKAREAFQNVLKLDKDSQFAQDMLNRLSSP